MAGRAPTLAPRVPLDDACFSGEPPSPHPNPQPTATCLLVKAFVPQPKSLHPLTLTGELQGWAGVRAHSVEGDKECLPGAGPWLTHILVSSLLLLLLRVWGAQGLQRLSQTSCERRLRRAGGGAAP